MKRITFLSKVIGGITAIAAMPLGWIAANKPISTTKGIIPYIQEHQYGMALTSEFGYDEFMEMMEKVFQYSNEPKMISCVWCHEWVKPPDNCSCGRIKDVYKSIERLMNEAK